MRWDTLFADLEAQWRAQARRELDAEVADRTRAERASAGLAGRLAAARAGGPLDVALGHGLRIQGPVLDVGRDWFLLGDQARAGSRACLVSLAAVTTVTGLGSRVTDGGAARGFALGYALRGLSRDRAVVSVLDTAGAVAVGTIDSVGADVLELAEHPADLARRPANVTGRRLVPFAALALVRPA